MAFAGGEDSRPALFEHPALPCLQFTRLDALLESGSKCEIGTYQNDFGWGLCRYADSAPIRPEIWDGIYRYAADPDLPIGPIEEVRIWVSDTGDIAEVVLDVNGDGLLFIAAEVVEDDVGPSHVA